jgi:glycosyltransferase involved in cell wall biosynthesis
VADQSGRVPRVSIGLPVYNAGGFLEPALASVMGQTYEDFEFIISDNASTDGTSERCRELAESDRRVRYFRSNVNRGAVWNHNRLLALARGEYFKWCGHDDLIEPTFIERCVGVLDADRDRRLSLCFTLLDEIDGDGNCTAGSVQSPVFDDRSPRDRLRSFWSAPRMHQVIYAVMRRDLLLSTALLAPHYGSDRQTLLEMALLGGFGRVDETLFHHREHENRSQYTEDKQKWMTEADSVGTDFGYWRRVVFMVGVLGRSYLSATDRVQLTAEFTRYGIRRAPHWVPQLGREAVLATLSAVRRPMAREPR